MLIYTENFTDAFQAINPFKMPKEVGRKFVVECAQEIANGCGDKKLNVKYKLLVSFVTK